MGKPSLGRRAFTLIELLVVITIIAISVALLVPAVQKVRYVAARTQSTNNLKQCALGVHEYHDAWKFLPFNGQASATNADNASGSWAYQVLPYADQQPMYDSQPANSAMSDPVPVFLCAIRGRPGYYTGLAGGQAVTINMQYSVPNDPAPPVTTIYTASPTFTMNWGPQAGWWVYTVSGPVTITESYVSNPAAGPVTVTWSASAGSTQIVGNPNGLLYGTLTITSTGSASSPAGPATDFGINVFLNDPNGGINSPNVHRQLSTITDGTSNTILLGHAYVQTTVYQSTTAAPPSLQPIFIGGSLATGRNTLGDNATDWLQDGPAVTSNQWGSPMSEGGLMAMCDGTVRIFPYATPLTNFLLPDDGNPVELP